MKKHAHHTNTYEAEENKDKLLNIIKLLCFAYLENQNNIKHIKTEHLESHLDYIGAEYIETVNLKSALKVKSYHSPYREIYSNLDNMIVSQNLLSKDEKILFIELTKDINNLEDTLAFCYGILMKILNERKNI